MATICNTDGCSKINDERLRLKREVQVLIGHLAGSDGTRKATTERAAALVVACEQIDVMTVSTEAPHTVTIPFELFLRIDAAVQALQGLVDVGIEVERLKQAERGSVTG